MIRTQINIYSIRQNKNDANMNKNKKMLKQKKQKWTNDEQSKEMTWWKEMEKNKLSGKIYFEKKKLHSRQIQKKIIIFIISRISFLTIYSE